jgi:hypothetical protein
MKITLQIISGLALVGTIGPALIYLAGEGLDALCHRRLVCHRAAVDGA